MIIPEVGSMWEITSLGIASPWFYEKQPDTKPYETTVLKGGSCFVIVDNEPKSFNGMTARYYRAISSIGACWVYDCLFHPKNIHETLIRVK